jgi:undecaprenyl-diphosphatase
MFFGLSRQAATEFSFFLALPTLSAAALYDLWKQRDILTSADLPFFAVGFLAAFGSAILAVRGLIRYVAHHDFSVFAWYRIVFGGLVLVSAWMGWISWTAH